MEDMIYSLFKEKVSENPDAMAVTDGQQTLTYAELDRLVNVIQHGFPNKCPARVGVLMNHGVEMIAVLMAILKSGAAYVPVEPSFPPERIRYMMEEARVDFVITNEMYADRIADFPKMYAEQSIGMEVCDETPMSDVRPDSPAYILYTSGTTGKPKGVIVSNRNVCHYARAFAHEFHVREGDTMLQHSVVTFDIFVEEVFATLLNGAALAIPSKTVKSDLHRLMEFIEHNGVTMVSGFPYLLLEMNKLAGLPRSLRLLISGGDVLRASYVTNLIGKVDIYNTYGPSETTVCATYFRCNGTKPLPDGTYPIGKPVKGASVDILDENLRPVPDGKTGEICIGGGGISLGYLGHVPEARNFTHAADGRAVYRSGDLGYRLPNGNIAFLHRKDRQVMIKGKRVECNEVENVLCACKEVENGVVCPYTDEQGLSYLVAYFTPQKNPFSLRALKQRLSLYLPPFMIPEFFVRMKSMPLTPNGKIDRKCLPVILKEECL